MFSVLSSCRYLHCCCSQCNWCSIILLCIIIFLLFITSGPEVSINSKKLVSSDFYLCRDLSGPVLYYLVGWYAGILRPVCFRMCRFVILKNALNKILAEEILVRCVHIVACRGQIWTRAAQVCRSPTSFQLVVWMQACSCYQVLNWRT